MPTITTVGAFQASKGQAVRAFLGTSDTSSVLPTLTVGQKCTNANSKVGYISSIDKLGNSFLITPVTETTYFDSSATPGVLNTGESIVIV